MKAFAIVLCTLFLSLSGELLFAQGTIKDVTEESSASKPAGSSKISTKGSKPAAKSAATATENSAQELSLQSTLLNQRIDSLKLTLAILTSKVPVDPAMRKKYDDAVYLGWRIFGAWLLLVLLYLCWAIHRYVYNYGLSNREWKVLYPEIFESSLDRLRFKLFGGLFHLKDYRQRRDELIEYKIRLSERQQSVGEDMPALPTAAITKPFDEPPENPYKQDSFGLPPGTIRGILALTALVMFLIMEGVNLYSGGGVEEQFSELVTAFEMVLAFYFGSRAVEVLQARSGEKKGAPPTKDAGPGSPEPEPPSAEAAGPTTRPPVAAALEQAVMPASKSAERLASIVMLARDEAPAAATQTATGLTRDTPLAKRVLALTASFETSRGFPDCFAGLSGNFDGQGISFGALQWNIGQGSLQPLWKQMRDSHDAELKSILGSLYDEFSRMLDSAKDEQMRWALTVQRLSTTSAGRKFWAFNDDWKKALRALGASPEMIDIQVSRANSLYQIALGYCRDYGLTTERGAALMFDIRVQNGSVDLKGAGSRIRSDFELISPESDIQVERMRIIARRRSEVSSAQWRSDVLARKMTIAEGKGMVHQRVYDLEKEFAIRLVPISGAQGFGGVVV